MKSDGTPTIHVGNLVKSIMKSKQIKHQRVYDAIGVGKSYFSQLLKEGIWPSDKIEAASIALDTNLFAYFVNGTEYNNTVNEDTPVYAVKSMELKLKECRDNMEETKRINQLLQENNNFLKARNRELEIAANRKK